jgi:hypothetical protein
MLDDVEQRLVGVLERKELECNGEVLRMNQSMEVSPVLCGWVLEMDVLHGW